MDSLALGLAAVVTLPLVLPVQLFGDAVVWFDLGVLWFFSARAVRPRGFAIVAGLGYFCVMFEEMRAEHWLRMLAENCAPLGAWYWFVR